ncbi:hypothetical protein KBD71_00735 [Candidatus Woesebacteria bacterium]|nr:hypothetical protein [Candidatus Woesebacteria bacterium]
MTDHLKRFDRRLDYTLGASGMTLGALVEGLGLGSLYNFILTGLPQEILSRPELLADPRCGVLVTAATLSVLGAIPISLGAGSIESARR